ncbi:MAG: histidinol dehydrogenase [Candidatus Levybacteria bacterium RIFCSPHIGHO2_01_FULL_36_15]|nr:MAG: histidinol dehydrogenase [Candidatus Levybacteria bacterium RIFCSPHIGHO2_01_FULL_36_15]OGH38058.1 MAG: histidinol dehydrogenase [Candidatus Levybacteria bacterium RIFCSPLOWO2_01_FULL_36_10]
MKVINLKDLSKKDYQRIVRRSTGTNPEIMPKVRMTMEAVRKYGDKVLIDDYKRRFGEENYKSLLVSKAEIKEAYKEVSEEFISGIKQMIKNITAVHQAQLPTKKDTVVNSEKGISVWREWRPIEKVGLYIPGGKAIYPSSVLMSAIPAQIAGCKEIIMCSPARGNGQIPAPTLVAADMIGLTKIYKTGGAEAIAAMTYGTETIPNVYKIFGAGNSYVTAAKMLALETISIDMPAGPSEVFVVADETANPAYIAADLLADGEHGEDSACVLITTFQEVAEQTIKEIEKQLPKLSTEERARESIKRYGLFAVVDSLDEAIAFTNEYAPEHLEIMTRNPEALVKKITNAGSVFLGDWTSKATGDYATGANHVLPTGGMAKMYPPLGVDAYGKWMQVQRCTKEGLRQIKNTIEIVAVIEQLPAHKNSVSIRF